MPVQKIYEYLHNLRIKTKRVDYLIQRRRVAKGNGQRTLGWVLSRNDKQIKEAINFNDIINYKRKIEDASTK